MSEPPQEPLCDPVHASHVRSDHVHEEARDTPIAGRWDVIVAGGGPAGMGAALAAADCGARVLIIERHGMLGGVWTAGLLNPFFDQRGKGYLVDLLIERLRASDAWAEWRNGVYCFDIELMKYELERWCDELGIAFWYHCPVVGAVVEDGHMRGVLVEGKSGREAVLAPVCIDTTGDGDLAARAGARYELGRPGDGACQPQTMMFEIDGLPEDYVFGGWQDKRDLYQAMAAAVEAHDLPPLPIGPHENAPYIINLPRPGHAVVQYTHVYGHSALSTRAVSQATADARRQAVEMVRVLQHLPGFERVQLVATAPALGIREARRICGDYRLDADDLIAGATFDDAVTFGSFGMDVHDPAPGSDGTQAMWERYKGKKVAPYHIPYRSLLPADIDGLLVAGRCISGSHIAHSSYRVTGTCMAMGQAAGVAAARAAAEARTPRSIDGAALHAELAGLGVRFEKPAAPDPATLKRASSWTAEATNA